jgi:predicted nucleic acid-binding Zn ribbon protein
VDSTFIMDYSKEGCMKRMFTPWMMLTNALIMMGVWVTIIGT